MKMILRIIFLVSLFSAVFFSPPLAQADMAPPAKPPGANPKPGSEVTQVRMVAETVLIEIQPRAGEGSLGQAKVTAEFTMRNLGNSSESMAARFPVGASDGYREVPEITDFRVTVNGNPVATRQIEGEDPRYPSLDLRAPWEEFDITFPPAEDVTVVVTYTLEASGEYPYVYFEYLLTTGAAWKDTIGSAEIIARFPYEVSSFNVIIEPSSVGLTQITRGAILSGNEVRWYFEDFEPTREEDIRLLLVSPDAWGKVLKEREILSKNPQNGEAWGRLGKSYKEIIQVRRGLRSDPAGLQLYDMSVEAYETCLELLPEDALWHAGYAELLWMHSFWAYEQVYPEELLRASQEINLALELAPQNEAVLGIVKQMTVDKDFVVDNYDGTYALLWLTATPTTVVKPTATHAIPTTTPIPAATLQNRPPTQPVPTSEPAPEPSTPLCGLGSALPLALFVFMIAQRKSRSK